MPYNAIRLCLHIIIHSIGVIEHVYGIDIEKKNHLHWNSGVGVKVSLLLFEEIASNTAVSP